MRRLLTTCLSALVIAAACGSTAAAEGGGFFKFHQQHTTIKGGGGHALHFTGPGLSSEVGCGTNWTGTSVALTTEELTLTAEFTNCIVTSTGVKAPIDTNGCHFRFTVRKFPTEETEHTVHLVCPVGQVMRITRPDCTIVVPVQTQEGVTYSQTTNLGAPALKINFNSNLVFYYESGSCTSLGTTQTGKLKGSATLSGWNPQNGQPGGFTPNWSGGHFVTGVERPTITGTETAEHHLDFVSHVLGGEIGCKKSTYSLTSVSETAQFTTVTPVYGECSTTGTGKTVLVGLSGCSYRFDVVAGTTSETEQKVDFVCPTSELPLVLHETCALRIPPQEDIGKITYTTIQEGEDHAITLDVNAEFNVRAEGGPCAMFGTNQTATLKGSVLVRAFSEAGEQVDLTAT
jgi:hypothetical protein